MAWMVLQPLRVHLGRAGNLPCFFLCVYLLKPDKFRPTGMLGIERLLCSVAFVGRTNVGVVSFKMLCYAARLFST